MAMTISERDRIHSILESHSIVAKTCKFAMFFKLNIITMDRDIFKPIKHQKKIILSSWTNKKNMFLNLAW